MSSLNGPFAPIHARRRLHSCPAVKVCARRTPRTPVYDGDKEDESATAEREIIAGRYLKLVTPRAALTDDGCFWTVSVVAASELLA